MKRRLFAGILVCAVHFVTFDCQASGLSGAAKVLDLLDLVSDASHDLDSGPKGDGEWEREVQAAVDGAYRSMARADTEASLLLFQKGFDGLGMHWTVGELRDPAFDARLEARRELTESLLNCFYYKGLLLERIPERYPYPGFFTQEFGKFSKKLDQAVSDASGIARSIRQQGVVHAAAREIGAERDQRVQSVPERACQVLARADREAGLGDFQKMFDLLAVHWVTDDHQNPEHVKRVGTYAELTNYLSNYLALERELILKVQALNHDGVLVDQTKHAQSGARPAAKPGVSATPGTDALAGVVTEIESLTANLDQAVDHTVRIRTNFRQIAGIQ